MSHVVAALRSGLVRLRERPRVAGLVAAASVLVTVASPFVAAVPWIGWLLVGFVLSPVFLAGSLGVLAADDTAGSPIEAFLGCVRDRGVAVVLAGLAITLVMMASLFVVVGLSMAAGLDLPTTDAGEDGISPAAGELTAPQFVGGGGGQLVVDALTSAGPVLLSMGAAMFVVFTVLQFVEVAVVVDGATVREGFRTSLRLLAESPASVLGYTLVRDTLALATISAPTLLAIVESLAGVDLAAAFGVSPSVLVAVTAVVLAPLGQVVVLSYHVSYYRRLTAPDRPDGQSISPATTPA